MPVISVFFGIVVRMFHQDHNPPHIHVQYGEYNAIVAIKTTKLLHGKLPPRVLKILREWMGLRKSELELAWAKATVMKNPNRIKPIDEE